MSRNFLSQTTNKAFGEQLVAFAGPRQLTEPQREFIISVVQLVIDTPFPAGASSRKYVTGCAIGADETVIDTVRKQGLPVRAYTIMDPEGMGAWRDTNIEGVQLAAFEQQEIIWCAGGPVKNTLGSRLRARTIRMLDDISETGFGSGLVAFWAGTRGTEMTIEEAVRRSIPVVAYPMNDQPLPPIKGGKWHQRNAEGLKGRGFFFKKE